jgi:hypothetical protein
MSATMNNEWTTHANSYRPKTIENEVWYMSIQAFLIQTSTTRSIYIHICVSCECHCAGHYRIGQNIVHACHCNSWTQRARERENESSIYWKSSNTNKFVSSDREKEFSQISKKREREQIVYVQSKSNLLAR